MNVAEMIYVLRQCQDGKQIQWRFRGLGNWEDCTNRDGPDWAFNTRDYRVKPEPREFWLCNGQDRKLWIVVEPDHPVDICNGDKIKVREVLE